MFPIKPYNISIPDQRLDRLRKKLALTDFPSDANSNDIDPWSRGTPLTEVKRLAAYWANGFDWKKAEAKLNEFPQYTTEISVENFDTYKVHFVHQRSVVPNAIPLLFVHGWPGSFVEVTKILPQLIKGGNDSPAFHVVAPSLINFGFSSASGKARAQYTLGNLQLTSSRKDSILTNTLNFAISLCYLLATLNMVWLNRYSLRRLLTDRMK